MYRRFSAFAFEPCLEENAGPETIYAAVMSEGQGASIPTTASVNALLDSLQMQSLTKQQASDKQRKQQQQSMSRGWSQTIRPFALPYGMDLVLGDVCGGASSVSMVSAKIHWTTVCTIALQMRCVAPHYGLCSASC
jgi:hypothetical protein